MTIDFHSHILPGIDDGSRDLSCTEELLLEEIRQGVGTVCATPHFYASHVSVHDFLLRRNAAFEKTRQMCLERGINLPILLGAEVHFFPGMGEADKLRQLTLQGSDILLLEMPFDQWTEAVYREVEKVVRKQRLTVMLAHLERYFPFQRKKDAWERVLDLPVIVQLNAECVEDRKKFRFAQRVLDADFPVVLGSDCHNMGRRAPNLEMGRAAFEKKLGPSVLSRIDSLSEELLRRTAR